MATARQISMHEVQAEIKLAMMPDFLPNVGITSPLDLSGYGMSMFNTKYCPRQMTETFTGAEAGDSNAEGWIVTYNAVNNTRPVNS
jgi:hypothetical protein